MVYGVLATFAVLALFSMVRSFGSWQTSSYIQHHGVRTTGTITKVIYITHYPTKSADYSTINLELQLPFPGIKGQDVTTVTTPYRHWNVRPGQTVSVLVDPRNPSKAEMPGKPMHSVVKPIVALVLALIMLLPIALRLSLPILTRLNSNRRRVPESKPTKSRAGRVHDAPHRIQSKKVQSKKGA